MIRNKKSTKGSMLMPKPITQKYQHLFEYNFLGLDAIRRFNLPLNLKEAVYITETKVFILYREIHKDLKINPIKKFHDQLFSICSTCDPNSSKLLEFSFEDIKESIPVRRNLRYFLLTSAKLIKNTLDYYLACQTNRHTFASEEHPCATCKGTTKACASIITNGKIKTYCVDDWKL